jgi:hypothetical protein
MKRFRKLGLIILFSVGAFILLAFVNPSYTKTLNFQNHSIEYTQYLFGREQYFGSSFELEHTLSNYDLFEQANLILAARLCREYIVRPDSTLAKRIQMIAKNHIAYERDFSIDSLIKDREEVFDTIIYIE